MMSQKQILLTNDDGIESDGLKILWKLLRNDHHLTIAAPNYPASGAALSTNFSKPLISKRVHDFETTTAWAVSSTPVDCVRFAMHHLKGLSRQVDLVVSGINYGLNAGRVILYSGTVGAAIEATLRGIPSIALSIDHQYWKELECVKPYFEETMNHCLAMKLPAGTLLNVNFPNTTPKGIRLTRQGTTHWEETICHTKITDDEVHFGIAGEWDLKKDHLESDVWALAEGYISVTPIFVAEVTHHPTIEEWKRVKKDLNLHHFFYTS